MKSQDRLRCDRKTNKGVKMVTPSLVEKHADKIQGVISCYDRLVITGTLPPLSYPQGMAGYLSRAGKRLFDFGEFVKPLRENIRSHAQAVAQAHGVEIEFIRKQKAFRKEARIAQVVQERGNEPGLVHIFSAMEGCRAYEPHYDQVTKRTTMQIIESKCLHYYFYFIDAEWGLCYLRVPTCGCPLGACRLQFYCNGHNWLAQQLKQAGIAYAAVDNAFVQIGDIQQANHLATQLEVAQLHSKLDEAVKSYMPVAAELQLTYTWSIMQAEYATDIIFKEAASLQAFYPHLIDTLIQAVKPADIATFLGRKLHGNFQGEMGSRMNQRWLGTRLKHQMGPVSIKLYDKFQQILRIETTVNDVTFFDDLRPVQHRDGTHTTQRTKLKKSIYSLPALQEKLHAANQRYLLFLSAFATPELGVAKLQQLTETVTHKQHRYKGFHLLTEEDTSLFRTLLRGEFVIAGFSNKQLRQALPDKNTGQITRLLKRLHVHGLVKRVAHSYKYYLTVFGRQAAAMALSLRSFLIIPVFAAA